MPLKCFGRTRLMQTFQMLHLWPQEATSAVLGLVSSWTWPDIARILDLSIPAFACPKITSMMDLARHQVWKSFEDLEKAWQSKVCMQNHVGYILASRTNTARHS
eukprot:366001-Chlamydomonas_euryale.AAC.4